MKVIPLILGSVYHNIGSLEPTAGQNPKFEQIHIHDTDYELENRLKNMQNLSQQTLSKLQNMFHSCNPFIESFKMAYSLMQETHMTDVRMIMRAEKNSDLQRYNIPTSSEIAIIMPGNNNENVLPRDIVLHKSGGEIKRINSLNSLYDPLHYVTLLFPYGDLGFELNIP